MTHPAAGARLNLWLLLAAWAVIAGIFVARSISGLASTPLILDTDDAMRLTVVHDFLAGQNWYDHVQHRLNVPFGAEIHWSRLIDLPEAALLILLRPFGALADSAAATIWPLGLLFGLLWINGKLALRLGGREALLPALLLPGFSLITMAEFAPGRFDHHGPQIILSLIQLGAAIAALARPRAALVAGFAAALSLGIGIEGLPMIAATALAFGLSWVAAPRHAVAMRDFGLSFAVGAILALALGVAPSRWLEAAYDQISIIYVAVAVLCGAAFVVLSLLRLGTRPARLVAGMVTGGLVAAIALVIGPDLLKGPYASLDPWLITNWIDRIGEAQPLWVSLVASPAYPLAVLVPVLVALFVIFWQALRGNPADRGAWLIYGLFLLIALGMMLLQIRAARTATPLAVPAAAVLVASARQLYLTRKGILPILGLVGSWCISAGIVVALIANIALPAAPASTRANAVVAQGAINDCLAPAAFASLAAQPPERIMTPIDLGAHMLLFTPHSVVAAPYHRNAEGVRDAFRFFNEPIDVARGILDHRGIGLVVICPAMTEVHGIVDYADDSFVALYAEKRLPNWLIDKSIPGEPLQVFAVAPR